MSFVSHAQNFEDVMLWRALRHVERGTYLDIGAQDPVLHSVSLAFYDLGWRGVHVEPTPRYAAALRTARPEEQVVEALVGGQSGIATLFEIPDTGLSTGIDAVAERHRAEGWELRPLQVPVVSLADLFDLFDGRDVHWMKVDVEGMEPDVLASWGDHPARPWVVTVESVAPMSQVPTHEAWIGHLTRRDYREVYFDGLNRFFVADGRADVAATFDAPPNVFDGFVVADDHFAGALLRELGDGAKSAANAEWQGRLDAAERARRDAHDDAAALRQAVVDANGQAERVLIELRDAELGRARAEAGLRAEHAEREARLGEEVLRAGAELLAAKDEVVELHRNVAEREAHRGDELREAGAALAAAKDQVVDARRESAEREELLHARLRDAGAALAAAKDEHSASQAETARRMEALGAAHAEHLDRLAAAGAERDAAAARNQAELSHALGAAHARIAAADAQLGRAALLLHKLLTSRGWRWTAALRTLANPRRAPALARQAAALATELAGRAEAISLATPAPSIIAAGGDGMASAQITSSADEGGEPVARTLGELLAPHDVAFVRSAYLTVLGRPADPEGEAHHLTWLRRGVAKLHILRQMRRSPEGRAHDPGIAGLDRATRRFRAGRTPLIGPVIRMFNGAEGDSRADRRHRATLNQIGVVSMAQAALADRIEATLGARASRGEVGAQFSSGLPYPASGDCTPAAPRPRSLVDSIDLVGAGTGAEIVERLKRAVNASLEAEALR